MEKKKRQEKKGIEKGWNKEKMEHSYGKKSLGKKDVRDRGRRRKKKKRNDRY